MSSRVIREKMGDDEQRGSAGEPEGGARRERLRETHSSAVVHKHYTNIIQLTTS